MSDNEKIYVDAGQPATLNNGGGVLDDCPTLQEAVIAWHRLPPEQKERATIKVIGGPDVYKRQAILPGNLNDDEITTIIQRLASKHLTEVRGRAGSNFRRVALAGAVGEDEILAR